MEGAYELPGYTPREVGSSQASQHSASTTAGSEFTISREDNKGHKWLLLSVKSRSPKPNSPPVFYAGDLISGSVTLDVLKSESSKAITVGASHNLFLKFRGA